MVLKLQDGLPAHLPQLAVALRVLQQARQRPVTLDLVRGRAGRLPFSDGTFDLVYCVNAIHHFDDRPGFVAEARRLLRAGGALAVAGMDPRRARAGWYVYDYFPGTYEADLARFPSWGTVADWMIAAGFERLAWRTVETIYDAKVGRAVLRDPFPVSYTHLRAHETVLDLVCRLLLEKKNNKT